MSKLAEHNSALRDQVVIHLIGQQASLFKFSDRLIYIYIYINYSRQKLPCHESDGRLGCRNFFANIWRTGSGEVHVIPTLRGVLNHEARFHSSSRGRHFLLGKVIYVYSIM